MVIPTIRLLPFERADGPHQMAADEIMLEAAIGGVASLRFYEWSPPTLSLGYFQRAADRLTDPRLAALPWVRRQTGGNTLVHHHEVTYALALPPGPSWHVGESWMPRMHRIIAQALAALGVQAALNVAEKPDVRGAVLCFQQHTPGDLVCRGAKIVGSAQRKKRRALLQHGGILLARSEHAPELLGLADVAGARLAGPEVADAVAQALADASNWQLERGEWSLAELTQFELLVTSKYSTRSWNEKR